MNTAIDDLNPDLRLGVQAYSFLASDKGPGAYAFADFADIINARYASPNARAIAEAFRAVPDGVLTINANRTVSVDLPDARAMALQQDVLDESPAPAQAPPALTRGAQAGAKKYGRDKEPPRDLRQEFTDKAVVAIESGKPLPWDKPWHTMQGLPRNAVSNKPYAGGNRVVLALAAMEKGYTDPRWMTVKQSNDLDGHVRKGEKGVMIERWDNKPFWKRMDVELKLGGRPVIVDAKRGVDAEGVHLVGGRVVSPGQITVTHEQRTGAGVIVRDYTWKQAERELNLLVGRNYVVFNAEQCAGLNLPPLTPRQDIPVVARGERLMSAMQEDGLRFVHQGSSAYYSPAGDLIALPPRDTFKSVEGYYGTALHEMGHATGAEKRLNREGITGKHAFGSEGYAKEELRAELFSAFMSAETGIPHDDDQHTAYLQSWSKVLKQDKNEIFRAAAEAGKAVDYVLAKEQALLVTQERQASVEVAERAADSAPQPEPTQGKLKTVEIDAPAHWASALVNRDESGLGESEAACVKDWVEKQGVGYPSSMSDPFMGRHEGLLTEMATYSFLVPEKDIGPSVDGGMNPDAGKPHGKPPTLHEALESSGWKSTPHGSYEKTFLLDKEKSKGVEFTRGHGTVEKILNVKTLSAMNGGGFVIQRGWEDIPVPVKDGLSPKERVAELDQAAKQLLMSEHGKSLGVTGIRGKGEPEVQPAPPAHDRMQEAIRREDALLAKKPHELTFAEFATVATAQKLDPNHGREWAVFNGSVQRGELMGYAEGPTADDALRMMHKNRVNNALYDNMPDAVHPPGMEPKSMPPQQVLNEYPDLKEKFAPAIKEHRQMLDKEDRKAADLGLKSEGHAAPSRPSRPAPRPAVGMER
jgi:antirestriction protein ArdC